LDSFDHILCSPLKILFEKEGFLQLMSKYNKQYSLTQEFVKKGEIV